MKKAIFFGVVIIILGLLIALAPQFLFKVCGHGENGFPRCHWSAQAEIGIGLLIAALGACMIIFTDPKTHLGLVIGIFFSGIIALSVPNFLIGGCSSLAMKCRSVTFPALTAISIVLLVFSAMIATIIIMQEQVTQSGCQSSKL